MLATVTAELHVATSGLDPRRVLEAVPPGCRRVPIALPPADVDATRGEAILTVPTWAPHVRARHLLPAFSALTEADWSGRFEVSVCASGRWSPWVGAFRARPFRPRPGV